MNPISWLYAVVGRACRPADASRIQIESLESRQMLTGEANLLADLPGAVIGSGVASLPIKLTKDDSTFGGNDATLLAFRTTAAAGSTLHPAPATVRNSRGQLLTPTYVQPSGGPGGSFAIFDVTAESYTVLSSGMEGTSGAFTLSITLAGDINGDRSVTAADMMAIVDGLVEEAKMGNVAAAREVFDRILGRPVEADLLVRLEELEKAIIKAEEASS